MEPTGRLDQDGVPRLRDSPRTLFQQLEHVPFASAPFGQQHAARLAPPFDLDRCSSRAGERAAPARAPRPTSCLDKGGEALQCRFVCCASKRIPELLRALTKRAGAELRARACGDSASARREDCGGYFNGKSQPPKHSGILCCLGNFGQLLVVLFETSPA